MKKIESKYTTFFYNGNRSLKNERNTYLGYIPLEIKGIWTLIVDSETDENFAKIGVNSIFEYYFEKNDFSLENVNKILNIANKKIHEEKLKKNKDFNKKFSATVILSQNKEIFIGNIGKNEVKIFREDEIINEVSSNKIKKIEVEKYDYIIIGSKMFWKIMKNEIISKILSENENKIDVESKICKEIEKVETERNIVIPFMTIFIENLEEEKVEKEEIVEEKNPLKYFLIFLIFLTSFGVITKTFENNTVNDKNLRIENTNKRLEAERRKRKMIEEKAKKEMENRLKENNLENREIKENKIQNIGDKSKEKELKAKSIESNVKFYKKPNEEKQNAEATKKKTKFNKLKFNGREANNDREVNKGSKIAKKKSEKNSKKIYVKRKNTKDTRFYDLDREIKDNWEKLGRDENGNIRKVV